MRKVPVLYDVGILDPAKLFSSMVLTRQQLHRLLGEFTFNSTDIRYTDANEIEFTEVVQLASGEYDRFTTKVEFTRQEKTV